jgi:tol-pal system protein YbgF
VERGGVHGAADRIRVDVVMASSTKGSYLLPFAVFALALAVSGCADLMADDAIQQDVAQLRQDVNKLTLDAHRGRADAEALNQIERRTREQAAESGKQTAALAGRIETLNAEITRLSGRLDQLTQRLEALGRQAAPGAAAVPKVEPSPAAPNVSRPLPTPIAPQAPTPPVGPSTPSIARSAPSGSGPTPEESYQAAYLDFSKGHYTLAIPAFREFVRRFPDSPLADSAQYAVGESYFSMARASTAAGQADKGQRELEQAVQEFRKVILNYPRGSKVPPALYKEALALTELKQPTAARDRLQYLLDHFPQSEEAPLAKERLASLRQ